VIFKKGSVNFVSIFLLVLIPLVIAIAIFAANRIKKSSNQNLSCKDRDGSNFCERSLGDGLLSKPTTVQSPEPTVLPKTPTDVPQTNDGYNMKVLVIKYFPLIADGQKIDVSVTGDVGDTYRNVKQHTVDVTNNLVNALQKATTYLGYKDSRAVPSLRYNIVDTKEFISAVPMFSDGTRKPDYYKLLSGVNICDYVKNKGVNEVFLWAYQGPTFAGSQYPYLNISESKMAGPNGDISNSYRTNDMPKCDKTYRVYTFNYGRGTAEAMESWGHQLEAELSAVNSDLFRNKFQGPNYPQKLNVNGRCGSVHNPPNAVQEYDRANSAGHPSDCLDWNPDGLGSLSSISCSNWGCPNISDSNNGALNYMIWNWQNLPGMNNTKTYQGKRLRNWWDVHSDFDNVLSNSRRLTAN